MPDIAVDVICIIRVLENKHLICSKRQVPYRLTCWVKFSADVILNFFFFFFSKKIGFDISC